MGRKRLPREQAIALAKMARKNPDLFEEYRDDPNMQTAYNYTRAVLLNDEIKAFCKTEGITDLHTLEERLQTEKPGCYEHLKKHPNSFASIANWLENATWARKIRNEDR